MSGAAHAHGPLAGIRVLDLTSVVLGTFATQILGDLGADVLKVEPPGGQGTGGDIMRWGGRSPLPVTAGMGPLFFTLNRNKRSVTLDLKTPAGCEALSALIAKADIFASNIRADALARMGADYQSVSALKPDIIYCHASGYGSGGPYDGLAAYDDLIQAVSGNADLLSRADGDTRPRYFPALVADKTVGLYMAYAMMAGLHHRHTTGQGQFIEVPMFECFTHFILSEALYGHAFEPPTDSLGYGRVLNPHRRPYQTADGHIALMPYSDRDWAAFFALAERPDLAADPRFASYSQRMAHITTLYAEVDTITRARTTKDWLDLLWEARIPAMPVHRLEDVLEDPHLTATQFFRLRAAGALGTVREMAHPVRFSAQAEAPDSLPPALGADTRAVLLELGLADETIAAWAAGGAFGPSIPV